MSKSYSLFKSKSSAKRKYGKLTLQQKIEIIQAAEAGFSQRTLASQYNCGKTQIHLLVTQKKMWLDKWRKSQQSREDAELETLSDQEDPSSKINDAVFDFYAKLQSVGVLVSSSMLQERAVQVAYEFGVREFCADSSWLETFSSQYDVDLSENDNDTGLELLRNIGSKVRDDVLLQSYELCDIYNLAEVRLMYKFVPNDSAVTKQLSTKDFLTVSLCYSAVGAKEAEVVVYDSSVHGELDAGSYSQCIANWKGMMTQRLYEKRLIQLNSDMAQQNRQILLLVDESKYSGSLECTMSNVTVKSISNCLPMQPVLCGVGHMLKFLYCRRLLRMLSAHLTPEGNVDELAERITLGKAVRLIRSAWDDLQPRTIQNSFLEAGLQHLNPASEDAHQVVESDESLIMEIKHLVGLVRNKGIEEAISDDVFISLVDQDLENHSISDLSDIEEDDGTVTLVDSIPVTISDDENIGGRLTEQSNNQVNTENTVDTGVSSLITEALPSLLKLDELANALCNKNQLHQARMLLNDLEDLFEDVIADFKVKKNRSHNI